MDSSPRVIRELKPTVRSDAPRWTGPRATRALKILAAFGLLLAFMLPGSWVSRGRISDVDATTFPAWHFIETGSFELSDHVERNQWFVETQQGVFSNRSPGAIGFATLAYAVATPWNARYTPLPGTLAAIAASWLAALLVAASAEKVRRGLWFPALILFGLGTATWSVSANQLWPHGPAQLAIALAVWLLLKHKHVRAGLAFAAAVLVRPPTIILALGVAVVKAWRERSWRPLVLIAGPAVLAGVVFLIYTRMLFGSWSPVASYEAVGGFYGLTGVWERAVNVGAAFVSPHHGVLLWSAWIGVCLLFAYRQPLSAAQRWLTATPIIGALYVAVHSTLEVASGAFFYNYRYPLEAITLVAPFLFGAIPVLLQNPVRRSALLIAGSSALLLQVGYLFLSKCLVIDPKTGALVCHYFGWI